jgi:hypothetical protein
LSIAKHALLIEGHSPRVGLRDPKEDARRIANFETALAGLLRLQRRRERGAGRRG